jgi:hypothetical protein
LRSKRNQRQVHLVQVLVEQDRDLQQRPCREPRHTHAAVSLQAKQCAQALLPAARRAQLDQEVRDLGAGVPQPVRRARRDVENIAGTERPSTQTDPEAELAGHALEALPLARVHVRRDEAPGPDEELGRHMICRPFAEDDRLARDRVGDSVYALPDHLI